MFDQGTRAFGGTPELSENRLGTKEQLLTNTKDSLVNDEIRETIDIDSCHRIETS